MLTEQHVQHVRLPTVVPPLPFTGRARLSHFPCESTTLATEYGMVLPVLVGSR
jgi:hypothetical protein